MGKRSNYENDKPKDFWPTIDPNVTPQPFIDMIRGRTYAEPCYGEGDLEDLLMEIAHCKWRSDIRETVGSSKVMDATDLTKEMLKECDMIITNPPFSWNLLKPLLDHLPTLKPTWFLLPANVMHNKRMGPYMSNCAWVISVGRLYWMDNKIRGVDDFAWFRFHNEKWGSGTRFVGRV
jgi:hypothetical protein